MLKIGFCYMDGTINKKIIQDFIVKEDYIIEQSKLKYSTDEPCIIYRTCIINVVYIKLYDFFNDLLKDGTKEIKKMNLSSNILSAIEIPQEVHSIRIYK